MNTWVSTDEKIIPHHTLHLKIIKALDEKDKKLMTYDLHVGKNFLKQIIKPYKKMLNSLISFKSYKNN